ncbi:uncharacterized protein LOC108032864 [Drosophila biarmipes]|uniref:uncharacterized protein LOC108032864 n=1 Tax=Drosophila biarmipes TaxID=125945 RepID=UPI0007E68790|nr:uncharacterized protein LOC108032864 [Drosophila biarmipes]
MHKQSSTSVSAMDQDEADSGDRNICRNKVPKKWRSFPSKENSSRKCYSRSDLSEEAFIEDQHSSGPSYFMNAKGISSQRTNTHSKHSKEEHCLEGELEHIPKDTEYHSSDQNERQSLTQPSPESTDRSKSFSQIYSEIFEESKERQQKAEWACRAFKISQSKLHRTLEGSRSRGPASSNCDGDSSLESEYSSNVEGISYELDYLSIGKSDIKKSSTSDKSSFKASKEPLKQGVNQTKDFRLKRSQIPLNKTELRGRSSFKGRQEPRSSYLYRSKNKCCEDSLAYIERSCVCAQETSVCSLCSGYSRSIKYRYEGHSTELTDERDYPADRRSEVPTTATSQSRSRGDYLSSCSTRHRHHHHYRRQRSVPKTYQDRANSPINIKTRRKTHDIEVGTDQVREGLLGRSSASVGVQYPSEDETEDWNGERPGSSLNTERGDPNESEIHEDTWLSDNEEKGSSLNKLPSGYDESLMVEGESDVHNTDLADDYRSATIGDAVQVPYDLDEYSTFEELSYAVSVKYPKKGEEYIGESSNDDGSEYLSDDYDDTANRKEGCAEHQHGQPADNSYLEDDQKLSNEDGNDEPSCKVAKSKSFLSLKIYDADEALLEVPKDFEGPAIFLDDDADFLDITLTDDEEKIRAKLMAAALTTKKSTPSLSAERSLQTRRSTEPSVLSYKPSVIFTRRSEVVDDCYVPKRNDRVALLAEKLLNSLSESPPGERGRQPPADERAFADFKSQALEEREPPRKRFELPLCTDRQLLSEEFNRRVKRQLKVIGDNFR